MATPLINGRAYTGSQIRVNVLGREVIGIIGVKYSDKQDMQNNYGQGNYAVSRGYGKITCEASLTLEMAEVEALQLVAPNGRLQEIPEFDIPVSYVDDTTLLLVSHTIKNCRFMENTRDAKMQDMSIEIELPLLVSHIKWK